MLTEGKAVERPAETQLQIVPRVYLTAFPKAGTHLAELYVRNVARTMSTGWIGSFKGNAWTTEWTNVDKIVTLAGEWPRGGYLKGHCGYKREIARALWDGSVATIFVWRDLRDVAVSQAYHVLDNRRNSDGTQKLNHPAKELYQALPTFDDVLNAVIGGIDQYPGVVERWKQYAGWMDEKWVLKLRFADMVADPPATASRVLRYVAGQTAAFYGRKMVISRTGHDNTVARMVQMATTRDTVTKRRGAAGGWREYWSADIQRLWERVGGPEWNPAE